VLVIPKKHIATVNDLATADAELAGRLLLTAARLARDKGCAESGYRLIFNCNHLHLHLLGGRPLGAMLAR
jgi:histidine triad (HIT) family protein